ncbi:MAG TPA: hypothetical protein VFW25_07935 [Silvibacterium sp.]|nr:hypothetical protein [Silvibacterium sp.]
MAWFDRVLSILLIVASIVHWFDSLRYYHDDLTLLWALCASLFIILVGVVNLLRTVRPADRTLAWICLVSAIAWIAAALRFADLTGRMVDSHVLAVVVITIGICIFSVRTLLLAKR